MSERGLKHLGGIVLAGAISLGCWYLLEMSPVLRPAPAPHGEERHDPLPGFLAVFIGLMVEVIWLQSMNLRENTTESETSRAEARQTKETLERVQADQAELLRRLGERIEHDRDVYYILRTQRGPLTKD